MAIGNIIAMLASLIGDKASEQGGSGGGGFGQVFSNIGNRDVKNKTARIGLNLMDFGGGFANTIAAFGGDIFGGPREEEKAPEQIASEAISSAVSTPNTYFMKDAKGYVTGNKNYNPDRASLLARLGVINNN